MNSDEREEQLKQIRERLPAHRAEVDKYRGLKWADGDALRYYKAPDDIDFLLSLLDRQAAELAEEKRLRSELKQIAQIGIKEVSSVGTRLQECAVRDTAERTATAMRDKCVEKVKEIHEERLRDLRTLTENGEIEHEDAEYERAVLFVLSNVITAIQPLTLDQVQEKQ